MDEGRKGHVVANGDTPRLLDHRRSEKHHALAAVEKTSANRFGFGFTEELQEDRTRNSREPCPGEPSCQPAR